MVRWDPEKDRFLKTARGISFQEIGDEIISGNYPDILENPAHQGQAIFVVWIKSYTWVVPFIVEDDETIFLKTAYPSRKFHRRYGGAYEEKDHA
jgi:hypothetical protein